jgi:PAS domain S-box-containing protein
MDDKTRASPQSARSRKPVTKDRNSELFELRKKLKESQEQVNALINLGAEAGDAIVMLQDVDGKEAVQTFVNAQWSKITGYTREELLGVSFFDLLNPEDREASLARHRQKMSGKAVPGLYEMSVIRKDGIEVPIELTGSFTTFRGQRINMVYIRDITERKKADAEILESEDRFNTILQLGADTGEAIVILQNSDRAEGRYVLVNNLLSKLTGYSKAHLLQQSIFSLLSPEYIDAFLLRYREVIAGNAIRGSMDASLIAKSGITLPVEITIAPIKYHGASSALLRIKDITKRKETEKALRDSEEKYHTFFHDAPIALAEWDYSLFKRYVDNLQRDGVVDLRAYFDRHPSSIVHCLKLINITNLNQAHLEFANAKNIEDIRVSVKSIQPKQPEQIKNIKVFIDDFVKLAEGKTQFSKEEEIVVDGREKTVLTHFNIPPGYTSSWSKILTSLTDITELRQNQKRLQKSESRLRLLNKQILNTQEQERLRIARELHDCLGHEVLHIKRKVQFLHGATKEERTSIAAKDLLLLCDHLIETVHTLSVQIRPMMLDDLGLEKTLRWYTENFERSNGICCVLHSALGIRGSMIGNDVSLAAYRVFEEAMSNVLKHSKAETIHISACIRKSTLIISVKDDGIGYSPKSIDGISLGLIGMAERAISVGGHVLLYGNKGKGAKVMAYFPLRLNSGA